MSDANPPTLPLPLSPALEASLELAVQRLRDKVDAVFTGSDEAEKMADLHYLAHELVDQHMEALVDKDPDLERSALVDLREQVARRVHRLIEATRSPGRARS